MALADSYFYIECYCVHVFWHKYVADTLGVATTSGLAVQFVNKARS